MIEEAAKRCSIGECVTGECEKGFESKPYRITFFHF